MLALIGDVGDHAAKMTLREGVDPIFCLPMKLCPQHLIDRPRATSFDTLDRCGDGEGRRNGDREMDVVGDTTYGVNDDVVAFGGLSNVAVDDLFPSLVDEWLPICRRPNQMVIQA